MVFPKLGHQSDKKSASNGALDRVFSDSSNDGLVELLIDIESPPCVLYGSATESTGALLSGLLKLRVRSRSDHISHSEPLTPTTSHGRKKKSSSGLNALSQTLSNLSLSNSAMSPVTSPKPSRTSSMMFTKVSVKSVSLSLVQKVRYTKPFVAHSSSIQSCLNCRMKQTELARWDIVKKETEIPVGDHAYPFSHLIPGSVPATVCLGSEAHTEVKYELVGEATYRAVPSHNSRGEKTSTVHLKLPIPVTRSILRGPDKNSLRIFPPTDLTATVVLPNIVYPKSTFTLELKLDGVSSEGRRWRMRRLNWKIEEKGRVRLQACATHKGKLKQLEKEVKETETGKKPSKGKPLKRTHDAAPQVTTTVCTLEDALSMTNAPEDPNAPDETETQEETSNRNQGEDDGLIHPSDSAMRQARVEEQQRLRQEMLQKELSEGTALFTEELRTIAHGEVKNGWKSDFTGSGKIELVTEVNCMGLNSGVSNPVNRASSSKPVHDNGRQHVTVACDVEDPHLGIYVQHLLILEIIVAEEALQYANGQPLHTEHSPLTKTSSNATNPDQRLAELSPMLAARSSVPQNINDEAHPNQPEHGAPSPHSASRRNSNSRIVGVPTGAARVLRMQFRLNITERSGLGISWDDEVPPTYQDVRLLSPPSYNNATSGSNTPLVHSDMDRNDYSTRTNFNSGRSEFTELSRPPQAHAYDSPYQSLSPVQSPQLENVVSIQGNAHHTHLLTPQNTQEVHLPSLSELLDTDRITQ